MSGSTYELLGGNRHRHGGGLVHEHPHTGAHTHSPEPHSHDHEHPHGGHGHSHGLVDESIKRSREGLRAVGVSLAVLAIAAGAQLAIFIASGSIALLADLIHNFGDASTAIPLGAAFMLRSARAERWAGLFVVATIFLSACVAGVEAISRLIHPQTPTHLLALAAAGLIGFAGNWIAAGIR
ncbi:MAG TPA: cation transporter, partial [Candidatus Dormibacteraeota bacterium]